MTNILLAAAYLNFEALSMSKLDDYAAFRLLLKDALSAVKQDSFKLPMSGGEEIVRERNFCYELYHQLRLVIGPSSLEYVIGPELDKRGHSVITNGANPDLVIHDTSGMDRNLCVIEVKPITGRASGFKKDAENLKDFVGNWSYYAGILLVFGPAASVEAATETIKNKIGAGFTTLMVQGVRVLWISSSGAPVVEIQ